MVKTRVSPCLVGTRLPRPAPSVFRHRHRGLIPSACRMGASGTTSHPRSGLIMCSSRVSQGASMKARFMTQRLRLPRAIAPGWLADAFLLPPSLPPFLLFPLICLIFYARGSRLSCSCLLLLVSFNSFPRALNADFPQSIFRPRCPDFRESVSSLWPNHCLHPSAPARRL